MAAADPTPGPFVRAEGTQLLLHGRPWHFLGANAYFLMARVARGPFMHGPGLPAMGAGQPLARCPAAPRTPLLLRALPPQTRAADPGLRAEVLHTLDAAVGLGLTVIRTWAFADGAQWNALQPAPGVCAWVCGRSVVACAVLGQWPAVFIQSATPHAGAQSCARRLLQRPHV